MTATTTARTAPSGIVTPPWTSIVQLGQTAEGGSSLPVGNTVALKPFVSRQYDWLWKIT